MLEGTEVTFEDQFGKSYTQYTEGIAVTVFEKSGGPAIVVIAAIAFLILKRKYGYIENKKVKK